MTATVAWVFCCFGKALLQASKVLVNDYSKTGIWSLKRENTKDQSKRHADVSPLGLFTTETMNLEWLLVD